MTVAANPSPVTLLIKPDTPKAVVVRELKNIMKFIQTEPIFKNRAVLRI